jgi:hypothetical protein
MQPYFDPTRNKTSKIKWKTTSKNNFKNERRPQKNENGRQPQFLCEKLEC